MLRCGTSALYSVAAPMRRYDVAEYIDRFICAAAWSSLRDTRAPLMRRGAPRLRDVIHAAMPTRSPPLRAAAALHMRSDERSASIIMSTHRVCVDFDALRTCRKIRRAARVARVKSAHKRCRATRYDARQRERCRARARGCERATLRDTTSSF